MSRFVSRLFAAALITLGGLALSSAAFDAEAARAGGGASSGRQSSNVSSQKPAAPAAATGSTTQKSATPPAAAAAPAAAAKPSGASRWLGPLAGIAAGLGIAAMLSHFGLGGAMGDDQMADVSGGAGGLDFLKNFSHQVETIRKIQAGEVD